ncbi:hypothetical protein [Geomicrobium sp. JCM 19039]|uniref:hypothetical protein n=1 Tax=Geomicrobium sp. JCM 19039 TaxID=1460636 RepID=UPI00045F3806|nr:hypothetical protein [Geomicrobium sp. JCM 19039]GAK13667.1 hypothetical protein JCM19039_3534 [Geomicrobium sp. JCM 19039]
MRSMRKSVLTLGLTFVTGVSVSAITSDNSHNLKDSNAEHISIEEAEAAPSVSVHETIGDQGTSSFDVDDANVHWGGPDSDAEHISKEEAEAAPSVSVHETIGDQGTSSFDEDVD